MLTVRAIINGATVGDTDRAGLLFEEIYNMPRPCQPSGLLAEMGFPICHFRRLRPTDITMQKRLVYVAPFRRKERA